MGISDFNWDEIKEKLQKTIKLEKNDSDLKIIIRILEENIQENEMVGNMLKGEAEMKQSLEQFLNKKESLNCDIEIDQNERTMILKFYDKKDFKEVYTLLNEIFFGDFLKKMIEALMGAFGGSFKPDDFKF